MSGVALVTGGSGFVGSHLVERLLADGYEVHCLDRVPLEESFNLERVRSHKGLHYLVGDIRDMSSVRQLFPKRADVVYHLASVVGVKNYLSDPLSLIDVVVTGTRNVVQLAHETSTRLVFASTSEIYGRNPKVPWDERDDRVLGPPSVDRWSYASSKAVCEHMINAQAASAEMPFSIVRFFNVYGPRQAPYYVVSQSIHRALNGQPPLMYDSGLQTRCFTYVDDIVQGVLLAGSREAALGETFNLGNPTETRVRDAIDLIMKACSFEGSATAFDTSERYGQRYEDIDRRIPAVEKARDLLGWQADTELQQGVESTVAWARANAVWLTSAAG